MAFGIEQLGATLIAAFLLIVTPIVHYPFNADGSLSQSEKRR